MLLGMNESLPWRGKDSHTAPCEMHLSASVLSNSIEIRKRVNVESMSYGLKNGDRADVVWVVNVSEGTDADAT